MLADDAVKRILRSLGGAELGDSRRSDRLEDLAGALARNPDSSLPTAMGSEARLEACYRLMNNEAVTFEALLESQVAATRERALQQKTVLVVHDTSEMKPRCATTEEVGYLKSRSQPGFLLHLSLALVEGDARRPLGVAHAETLSRKTFGTKGNQLKADGAKTAKYKDRESTRWLRGVVATEETLNGCHLVHVLDREGDSYALLAQLKERDSNFVIRCAHDRSARATGKGEEWSKLRHVVESETAVVSRQVPISARRQRVRAPGATKHNPSREARTATLQVAATKVTIPAPRYVNSGLQTVDLNVVRVWERDCPEGEEPIEWLLYTTEPVSTAKEMERVVDVYRARWLIEECFKAIKTGCAYEEREFESFAALRTLLAMTLPIAIELLWLRSRSREEPDAPAAHVLTKTQLDVLRALSPRRISENATVGEALLAVAGLGGHQRSNGPPGWQVLYRGMKALLMYEAGWTEAMRKMTDGGTEEM